MGLFDGVAGMISSAMAGGNTDAVAGQLMGALSEHGINGVGGLVEQFAAAGMEQHVASWVGNGTNLPIDPSAIEKALGGNVVSSIASKLGVDPATASQLLAQHLPSVVNHLTPDGQVPPAS
ncbi:MAG: hypothetical protein B7Z75_10200 [Acidocella sp. 20-57-95]|nr:MAG: hypothetical protein B7Z75_10200 [Acidocella sp. 20-57-95]OYV59914.1 MAG: hypothetical protein B7Z71_07125 [Acidocella sp. 21-58-7]HQT63065.1 YidB family protein [Acidocella sp.]HQU04717.1 YidB family protein [Acidocella sp.]